MARGVEPGEDAGLVEDVAYALVRPRAVMFAQAGGGVDAGQDGGLAGGALGAARHAQVGVGRDQMGVSVAESSGGCGERTAVEQRRKCRQCSCGQRVDLRVIQTQADTVKEQEEDSAHSGRWSAVFAFDQFNQAFLQNGQSRIGLLVGQPQSCRGLSGAFALILVRQLA